MIKGYVIRLLSKLSLKKRSVHEVHAHFKAHFLFDIGPQWQFTKKSIVIWFLGLIACRAEALPASTTTYALNSNELMGIFKGLLLVVVLIFLLSLLAKRLQRVQWSSSKGFQLVACLSLGPREQVQLLKVGGRYLLLGVASNQINLLYDFGEQLPAGFELDTKASFSTLLQAIQRKAPHD